MQGFITLEPGVNDNYCHEQRNISVLKINKSIKNSPWYTADKTVKTICEPLFLNTPISCFQYQRIYANGSRTVLSSNSLLTQHTFIRNTNGLRQLYTPFLIHPEHRYAYTQSWAEDLSNPVLVKRVHKQLQDEFDLFGLHAEFFLCEKQDDFYEFFTFWLPVNVSNKNFYLNHLTILEQFRLYFLDKGKQMIALADEDRVVKPWRDPNENLIFIDPSNPSFTLDKIVQSKRRSLHSTLFVPNKFHFQVGGIEHYITSKELLCILQLMRGQPNAYIARDLKVSIRTVEHHMDTLRSKTGVKNRQQLIDFFTDLGLRRLI